MKMHTTANGDQMYIAEMDNDHLKNTINSIFRNLETAKNALNQDSKNTINSVLYKSRTMSKDKAKYFIKQMVEEKLPHYIMEASLRGFDYSKELQLFFDRTEKLTTNQGMFFCPELDDDESPINKWNPTHTY